MAARTWFLRYRGARGAQRVTRGFLARRRYVTYSPAPFATAQTKWFFAHDMLLFVFFESNRLTSFCSWLPRVCACVRVCVCVCVLVGRVTYMRCAIRIQTKYRAHLAREKFRRMCKGASEEWKHRRKRRQRSIIIQRWYKTHYQRRKYVMRRDKARADKQAELNMRKLRRQARASGVLYRTVRRG